CLKTLEKRPQDRYASCQALAEDLRAWLECEVASTLGIKIATDLSLNPPEAPRRRNPRAQWVVVAVLLVCLAGTGMVWLAPGFSGHPPVQKSLARAVGPPVPIVSPAVQAPPGAGSRTNEGAAHSDGSPEPDPKLSPDAT